jgi:ferredoxin-type protein NapG
MDRRTFFRKALQQTSQSIVDHVAEQVEHDALRWIRPPYAQDELSFLLACTRCNACQEACPENVIFPLSPRLGVKVANTPAMDLLNHGCLLCEDWPCVNACEPKALLYPEENAPEKTAVDENAENDKSLEPAGPPKLGLPKLALAEIDPSECLPYSGPECGACANVCPIENTLTWHKNKPTINPENCVGCAQCRDVCIANPKAIIIKSIGRIPTDSQDTA